MPAKNPKSIQVTRHSPFKFAHGPERLAEGPLVTAFLFLASSNQGKLREFREAAQALGIAVEPVPNILNLPVCVEDGATFEANARKKALHYSGLANGLIFADDSGICVDALGGAPGVFSARYAGDRAADKDNNAKLLAELRRLETKSLVASVPPRRGMTVGSQKKPTVERASSVAAIASNRAAHYVCVIALAERGKILAVVEGRADGTILDEPRGSGGFGYDPFFFYPPLQRAFAELSPQEKFAVSHRGEAFRKLLRFVQTKPGGARA